MKRILTVKRLSDEKVLLELVDHPENGIGYNLNMLTYWHGENFAKPASSLELVTLPAVQWMVKISVITQQQGQIPRCTDEYFFPLGEISWHVNYGEGYELTRRNVVSTDNDGTH